jgi:hypothetical protein
LPVAVSLKRFLTPLLVLSLGIFVSLVCDMSGQPWQPLVSQAGPRISRNEDSHAFAKGGALGWVCPNGKATIEF